MVCRLAAHPDARCHVVDGIGSYFDRFRIQPCKTGTGFWILLIPCSNEQKDGGDVAGQIT